MKRTEFKGGASPLTLLIWFFYDRCFSHRRILKWIPRKRKLFKVWLLLHVISERWTSDQLNTFFNIFVIKIRFSSDQNIGSCAITLNYCTYTNQVGVSPSALYCVVVTSYGLGRSLGHCRPALPKGRKYQMVKTQTQSHDRRPVV